MHRTKPNTVLHNTHVIFYQTDYVTNKIPLVKICTFLHFVTKCGSCFCGEEHPSVHRCVFVCALSCWGGSDECVVVQQLIYTEKDNDSGVRSIQKVCIKG